MRYLKEVLLVSFLTANPLAAQENCGAIQDIDEKTQCKREQANTEGCISDDWSRAGSVSNTPDGKSISMQLSRFPKEPNGKNASIAAPIFKRTMPRTDENRFAAVKVITEFCEDNKVPGDDAKPLVIN